MSNCNTFLNHLNKHAFLRITIFDILLTAAYLLARLLYDNGIDLQQRLAGVLLRAAFLFLAVLLISLALLCSKRLRSLVFSPSASVKIINARKIWLTHFLVLSIVWGLCLLVYYPGVGMNDGLNVLMGRLSSANQFPIFYCIYVVILGKIGNLLGSLQYAVALYSIFQLLITAGVSSCILTFLWLRSSSRIYRCLISLYYIVQPVLAIYAIAMLKDTVFSAVLVLYGLLLFELTVEARSQDAETSGQSSLSGVSVRLFFLSSLILSALRSNGIYIVTVCLIYLLITLRANHALRRRILLTTLAVLMLTVSGRLIMNHYDVRHNVSETFGIPIQQISAVVAEGGSISQDELDELACYMNPAAMKELYNPYNADPVKWSDEFHRSYLNEHASGFLRLWAQLLPRNLRIYVKAYLQQTYWFWAPLQRGTIQMFSSIEEVYDNTYLSEFLAENGIHDAPILTGSIANLLKGFCQSGAHFLREGVCVWILLHSIVVARCRGWKLRRILPMLLPQLLAWLTIMVSTPISDSFRYVLFYAYAMPVFLLLLTHTPRECE